MQTAEYGGEELHGGVAAAGHHQHAGAAEVEVEPVGRGNDFLFFLAGADQVERFLVPHPGDEDFREQREILPLL